MSPEILFHFFDEITRIPRPSKHEEKIIQYLEEFARQRGLATKRDDVGDLLMTVPATAGHDHLEPVILQAHVDMVCEKNQGVRHDFMRDPISYYVTDDGWLRTNGTTLGADDGIGVAAALAIVESGLKGDLNHGPLYCLFTVDEETGLTGAYHVTPDFLPASKLINLDSEDEGQIFIGCAGGCTTKAHYQLETVPTADNLLGIEISLGGLLGGHSGGDIHLGRANANQLMARFVQIAQSKCNFRLASFDGGNLHNAIAREANVVGAVPFGEKENIRIELNCYLAAIEEEYQGVEPNIHMDLQTADCPSRLLTTSLQSRLVDAIVACPHGVLQMSHTMANLVQTSNNLASVKMKEGTIEIVTSQRSSVESGKTTAQARVASLFRLSGADVELTDGYPGWNPNPQSALLKTACDAYRELFGREAQVLAIHAGLECGLFGSKKRGLDMISIGPTLRAVHSPDEAVEIASVDKFWRFLINTLLKQ